MESSDNLLENIAIAKSDYDRLISKFTLFFEEISDVKNNDRRFRDIDIKKSDNNSMSIHFLDKQLIVFFTFSINSKDGRRGHITCCKSTGDPINDLKIIDSFNFLISGETDIPTSRDDFKYYLHHRADAVNILLNWVWLSVNETE
ncbi:MAG: hypothetical protein KUF75_13240 [Candidatus Thiodiazotropha sp. (ex Ctena orbiculata)]|nr:hypothetical protein [Candidatus Thiodiazotropha taylori]